MPCRYTHDCGTADGTQMNKSAYDSSNTPDLYGYLRRIHGRNQIACLPTPRRLHFIEPYNTTLFPLKPLQQNGYYTYTMV